MAVAQAEKLGYLDYPPQQDGRRSLWQEALWGLELAELINTPVYRGEGVPQGDKSPVIVIPGFLSNDFHTSTLRGWLDRIGYTTYPSDIHVANLDPESSEDDLNRKIDRAFEEKGPVHLLGHSIGGVVARDLASRKPEKIRSVTTLGSPLFGEPEKIIDPYVLRTANRLIRILRERNRLDHKKKEIAKPLRHKGVRVTSIFTRRDGVVDYRYCVDPNPDNDSIEVEGSHAGLIFNKEVYGHIGRILAMPKRAEITLFETHSRHAA